MIKLLIVDDEEVVRDGIRLTIDWLSNGIEVCGEAEDGNQALELIHELKPDILLMDIRMPLMNGLQVIEAVYAAQIPLKFIFLSGYDDFSYAQQAMKFGASAYLLKPCMPEEILDTILKVKSELQDQQSRKEMYESLQLKFTENLPFLKEKFLVKLIHNEANTNQHLVENFEVFKLAIDPTGPINVAIIQIDDHLVLKDTLENKEVELIKIAVKKIINEIIEAAYCCEVFEHKNDFIILAAVDGDPDRYNRLLDQIKASIKRLLGFTVSVGVGRIYDDFSHIHRSYMEAVKSIDARFLLGTDSLIHFEDMTYEEVEEFIYPIQAEKNVLSSLKTGNALELSSRLELFFTTISRDTSSKDHMLKSCLMLCLSLYHIGVEMNMKTDDIFGQGLSSIDNILKLGTLEQIKEKIGLITHSFLEQTLNRKSSNKIIESSLKYIAENYDKDLNLDKVANSIYINPGYFCLLFKKTVGTNFIDYLNKIRIEKACEQLKDIHAKSYEVAFKVGYSNEKYFYQIFKKYTGMTPTQYRESIQA
ncbi:response regulator [Paenibacillus psychroresistens]|uniref:Response regulator n=1 Tax=Paenibacillus psychroresistens TaxID=1778678 RepID=A0A6B8RHA9_9BACL|nr:response regulator [Paenibacillus psychroresistens]QGQ94768.1 response regulator [Paenibacillus psychroresistens]